MRSPCDPIKFDEQDWSQFDFSRWHLNGVQLDSVSQAVADLAQRLTNSPEWQQNVKASVPNLQRVMLDLYEQDSKQIQAEKAAVSKHFEERMTSAQNRNADIASSIEAAAAPLVIQASAGIYQLVIKIVASNGNIALPGMTVRLMDPRNRETALLVGVTDPDGNALLSIPEDSAKKLDNQHVAIQVADASGKVIQQTADAACIRLGQTETQVFRLEDSENIQANKAAALQMRARREIHADTASSKVDLLKQERESRLRFLDCKLQQNQGIVDSLQPWPGPSVRRDESATPREASPSTTSPAETSPSRKDSSRARGKGRNKS